jgi:hypothetical protein
MPQNKKKPEVLSQLAVAHLVTVFSGTDDPGEQKHKSPSLLEPIPLKRICCLSGAGEKEKGA